MSIYIGQTRIAQSGSAVNGTLISSGVVTTDDTPVNVKFWAGTKAEYDALTSTRDQNTIYYITDE